MDLLGAVIVVGVLIFGGPRKLNSMSRREKRRQRELEEEYEEYQERAEERNREIRTQYYQRFQNLKEATADELYDFQQQAIEEAKNSNAQAYNMMCSHIKDQLTDSEDKIAFCDELLQQLNEHLSKQQCTPLRQQTLKSTKSNLIEFRQEVKAYTFYLHKYQNRLNYSYNRRGELIPPFSMQLPEKVPYKHRIIKVDKSLLTSSEPFYLCVEPQTGVSYYVQCVDPENLSLFPDDEEIYCLVSEIAKINNRTANLLSCAEGMFLHNVTNQPNLGLDAVISSITQNENTSYLTYHLNYQNVDLQLSPKDCLERRRPVIGEHRRVYFLYWDYRQNAAHVTERYEDSLQLEYFHSIPLVLENNQVKPFLQQATKDSLLDSMDDWYIGPYNDTTDDFTELNSLKLQLGNKSVLKVRLKTLTSPNHQELSYLAFDGFLPHDEMFRFNDIYVAIDASLNATQLAHDFILETSDNVNDLLLYISNQFSEQYKIKNNQANILYFNQWHEIMKRLVEIKQYGRLDCKGIRILEMESSKTLCVFPEDIQRIQYFLARIAKKPFPSKQFLLQLPQGRSISCNIDASGEKIFLQNAITSEELEKAKYQADLYEEVIPYPELQQKNALEAFRLGRMTNAKLKSIIFDLPKLQFADTHQRVSTIANSSILQNPSQLKALVRAVAIKDFFLVQGPPGSGKTTLIKELIYQQLQENPDAKILIVSQANVAVDNVLRGLTKQGNLQSKQIIRCGNIDTISADLQSYYFENRFSQYIRDLTSNDCPPELMSYRQKWLQLLQIPDNQAQISEYLLNNYSVIGATCVGLAKKKLGLNRINFDLVIIDEAGKALPGELLIPINHAKKLIMIGDHKQLPPVVDPVLYNGGVDLNDVINENSVNEFFSTSFFQYLFEQCPPDNKCMLTMQFRMPTVIGNLISQLFYDGKLQSAPSCAKKKPLLLQHHLIFLNMDKDMRYRERKDSPQEGPYNEREVEVVTALVQRLREGYRERLVIITPYKKQKRKLQKQLRNDRNTIINTIDAFQGDEANIVIYCMTRAQIKTAYFSDNARLNVAMSRTKNTLIIVGAMNYLYRYGPAHNLSKIAKYVEQNGMVLTFNELTNPARNWHWNIPKPSTHLAEKQEVAVQQPTTLSPKVVSALLPNAKAKEEAYAQCRYCHKLYPETALTKGFCPDCLHDGIIYECIGCHKKMLYTNERHYIEKLPIQRYCSTCHSKVIKTITCNGCGKKFSFTRETMDQYLKHHRSLPLCCSDCNDKVYTTITCNDCGKRFSITYGEKAFYESHDWYLPTRCKSCRAKRKAEKNNS